MAYAQLLVARLGTEIVPANTEAAPSLIADSPIYSRRNIRWMQQPRMKAVKEE
jgi:hypothetical protein